MIITRFMAIILVSVWWMSGCTSLHYDWAYKPLHDAKSASFQKVQGKVEYHELEDIPAMVEAEREMYRKGYVMIGYSNMMSPMIESFAPSGARQLANSKGASVVLNTFGGTHFLATLWARPKQYVFGAFYTDDLSPTARAALKEILKFEQAVIVQTVVEDTPAFNAIMRPGDILISLNGKRIQDIVTLDKLLRTHAGTEVTFIVWSMEEGPPRPVKVALNPLVN